MEYSVVFPYTWTWSFLEPGHYAIWQSRYLGSLVKPFFCNDSVTVPLLMYPVQHCVHVCSRACVCVCVYVWYVSLCVCPHVCVYVYAWVYVHVWYMCMCTCVCGVYVWYMYVWCMSSCVCLCMCMVCACVCVCVCIYSVFVCGMCMWDMSPCVCVWCVYMYLCVYTVCLSVCMCLCADVYWCVSVFECVCVRASPEQATHSHLTLKLALLTLQSWAMSLKSLSLLFMRRKMCLSVACETDEMYLEQRP